MKQIFSIIISVVFTVSCRGEVMTLQECIQTCIDNNLALSNSRIGIAKARTEVKRNRSRLLPEINGVFQFTGYLKSPVNVTTGTLLGNDFPDDPTWQTIKSMPYNVSAGVQINMPLFNKSILAATEVAKTVEELSLLSLEKAEEELTMQVCKVYYLAQASLQQERLTKENISRMEELCRITEAMYQGGVIMETDLNRVRISLKNLNTLQNQTSTLHSQQINMLKYLLDLSPESELEVASMVENFEPSQVDCVSETLPELAILSNQKKLSEQQISAVKAGYLPTVALTGFVGGLDYQNKFDHFFHTKAATDNWFGNCYLALSVKVPLYDGNAKKLKIRQYGYEAQQAVNKIEMTQKLLLENFDNAKLQLRQNMDIYSTQLENRTQAENVLNVTMDQYKEGVTSMSVLLQDEMRLREAQSACVTALCQCNLAQLELLRLSGDLRQLSRQTINMQ